MEYGAPIRRHAALKVGNTEIQLDGVLVRDRAGKPVAIEVKLFREALVAKNLGNRITEIAEKARQLESASDVPLVVAIVDADLSSETRHLTSRELNHVALGLKRPIDVRFFDFSELRQRFGVSTGS